MTEEIRPCPFCGSEKVESIEIGQYHIRINCLDCLAMGPRAEKLFEALVTWNKALRPVDIDLKAMIEAWNKALRPGDKK